MIFPPPFKCASRLLIKVFQIRPRVLSALNSVRIAFVYSARFRIVRTAPRTVAAAPRLRLRRRPDRLSSSSSSHPRRSTPRIPVARPRTRHDGCDHAFARPRRRRSSARASSWPASFSRLRATPSQRLPTTTRTRSPRARARRGKSRTFSRRCVTSFERARGAARRRVRRDRD